MEQILKIALATIFGLAALAKFSGKSKDTFAKSGYSHAFMYAIAFAEVLLSAGLFTQYALSALIGLLTINIGAIITLIRLRVRPAKYRNGCSLISTPIGSHGIKNRSTLKYKKYMNKMLVAVFSNEELKADYTGRNEKLKQAGKLISEAFTSKEEGHLI